MLNLLTGKMKPNGIWRKDDEFVFTKKGYIPCTWDLLKVKNISKTFSGGTPSRSNKDFFHGNIPWVKSGEVNNQEIYYTEENINEDAIINSSTKYVEPETILFALYGATAGKLSILKIKACTNQAVLAILWPNAPNPISSDQNPIMEQYCQSEHQHF